MSEQITMTMAQFLLALVLIGTPVLIWLVVDLVRYERKHRIPPVITREERERQYQEWLDRHRSE